MSTLADAPCPAACPATRWTTTAAAATVYLALALVTTWPLPRVMAGEIAGDLGDPLLNGWILLWTSGQVLRVLHGDFAALANYWHGNIFYPAPLTLAYSEHLTPQMLQALPVLAVTHNVVLAYNLLLIATIVVSGVGAYLLVRELTGQPLAAFLAGAAFAYAPYRVDQWAHLQVLSSQWMPLTLFGFRRFFVTGRLRALAGGTAALVAQALSCGYYMAYFTPFAAVYCAYELVTRGRLRDRKTWNALLAAAAGALIVVAMFLWPYLQARRLTGIGVRAVDEVQQFSADTHAFATISDHARLWGAVVRSWPRNEGQGFPGFTVLMLAAIGVGASVARAIQRGRNYHAPPWRTAVAWGLGTVLLVHAALLVRLLWTGRATVFVLGLSIRFRYNPVRIVLQMGALTLAWLVASVRARRIAREVAASPAGFFAAAAGIAAFLALGPTVTVKGQPLGPGLYAVLYQWVPAFDGLRVPSLNLMLVTLFVAVLAGLGAAAISAHRTGRIVVVAAVIAILAESWSVPVETHAPPQVVVAGARAEPAAVYQLIRALPEGAVIAEFPFGDVFDEAGYTFAAGYHRKSIINGYSGFFPAHYQRLKRVLAAGEMGADVRAVLLEAGATHAIVHEQRYSDPANAATLREAFVAAGAEEIAMAGTDRVFRLR